MGNQASVYVEKGNDLGLGSIDSPTSLSFNNEESASSDWRMKGSMIEARNLYEKDGTILETASRGEVELRALLADPIGQPYIGAYAKANKGLIFLLCWIEIQEFKVIDNASAMLSKALLIYSKYIAVGSVNDISINEEDRIIVKDTLQLVRAGTISITKSVYNEVQSLCFQRVYKKIFRKFKLTEEYTIMKQMLKESSNFVRTQDFEYVRISCTCD